ncbi:MAG: type VI secretion system tube protein TssD [Nitrospirales bacterium]
MPTKRIPITMLLFTILLSSTTMAMAADNFYVTITGAIQGSFRGEVPRAGFENKTFRGLSFDYEVASLRDPQSGMLVGKRVHKPIILKKSWGPASVQLFSALTHNESLTVIIDFFMIHRSGKLMLDHTLKFNNAVVTSFHSHADTENLQTPQIETLELVFQSIEIIDHSSNATVIDTAIGTPAGR